MAMINVGKVDAKFTCKAQGMEVCFDPSTEEQFLCFRLAVQVSLPQLLQQLLEFQRGNSPQQQRGRRDDEAGLEGPVLVQAPQPIPSVEVQLHPAAQQPALPPPHTTLQQLPHSQPHPQPQPQHMPPQPQLQVAQTLGRYGLPPACATQMVQGTAPHPFAPDPVPPSVLGLAPAAGPLDPPHENRFQLAGGFLEALRANNVVEARRLLQQRADVNSETGPARMTPLHAAIEAGSNVETVNLLLKARANVNAVTARGETPLHVGMRHFPNVPPLVIRMLLCNQADLVLADCNGVTPLDAVRTVSMQSGAEGETGIAVRQLLDEVTELPTIDVCVVDGQVQGAHFADMQNDKVVISTESSIGVYSVVQKRIIFMKKLRQQQVISTVKHISVNAELGTIAVCLEVVEAQPLLPGERGKMQNVFFIWPNGKLQEEEPLKLSINVDPQPQTMQLPACAILSRTKGPQLLLSRLVDGKVFSWRLNNGRSQLVSEAELTGNAGIVAASDNCCWIAVVVHLQGSANVNVYSFESPSGILQEPRLVFSEPRNPQCMAIQGAAYSAPCGHLALAEAAREGQPPPPIEISAVSADGGSRTLYRLKVSSPCCSLTFCHGVITHVLSGHTDGLSVLYDLKKGQTIQCHGSPGTGCRSISPDRTLVVAAESHCFRVFKVPAERPT